MTARRQPPIVQRARVYLARLPVGSTVTVPRLARVLDCSQAAAGYAVDALCREGAIDRVYDGSWPRIYTTPLDTRVKST